MFDRFGIYVTFLAFEELVILITQRVRFFKDNDANTHSCPSSDKFSVMPEIMKEIEVRVDISGDMDKK